MAEDKKNFKNHQLLEICGVEMFKKIKRKKILEKSEGTDKKLLDFKKLLQKN